MTYHNYQFNDIVISSYSPPPSESSPPSSSGTSPAILIAIVVAAAVFFVLGLLHLVLRYFRRKPTQSIYDVEASGGSNPSDDDARALRRQLQQLFRLHDSGLDHASLDALPIFIFRDIVCLDTRPRPFCFDCAVCLSGFLEEDRLRLLPGCGHAFHLSCIDAWLLSNSTCPLCRSSLVDSTVPQSEAYDCSNDEFPSEEGTRADIERRVFSVILGKFRGSGAGNEEGSGCGLDGRRCYSMGSYQYVEGELNMTVELSPAARNRDCGAGEGKSKAGRIEGDKGSRGESFSISKIWLWSRNSRQLPP
ncbi:hypothetical protein MLD38_027938 [Melastoma candidum]|uniref:Uncharacterized protein n=1 Tax=Melastoma candidum TaxID=119954 RepID=A0ACB9MZC8_9MYRT|nr:hypothetical protein MLD38_027938 [Melastoma candidum]